MYTVAQEQEGDCPSLPAESVCINAIALRSPSEKMGITSLNACPHPTLSLWS